MEINWWMILIIVALVLTILDGIRRTWLEHKYGLRIKLDKNASKQGDDLDYESNNELPNGGARRKKRGDEFRDEDDFYNESDTYSEYEDDEDFHGNSQYENNSDAEEEWEYTSETSAKERIEPSFGDVAISEEAPEQSSFEEDSIEDDRYESETELEDQLEDSGVDKASSFTKKDQAELAFDQSSETEERQSPAEEVIVINVMAKPDTMFAGKDLLPILMKHNMRLGDMSIFHRYADANGNGPVMFSMANMVKPGTFDISMMEEFVTPGISFFLQLPNSLDNMQCFEKMLDAANTVKNNLNGELKDENRSVITRQTIDHSRQRIRDFELKQLSQKQ